MRRKLGVSNPKKPNRFFKIDAIKRYIFCSSYDEAFNHGEDGMVQVDYIDYGLQWDTLKPGQQGDTVCFEITDFTVCCPSDLKKLQAKWDSIERRRESAAKYNKARAKMKNRVKRMILGIYVRKYHWLPSLAHGRFCLIVTHICGTDWISSMSARLGVYLCSLAFAYCFTCFNSV